MSTNSHIPLLPVRRVVTGHDKEGKAQALIDAPATHARRPAAGIASTMMWCTDAIPAAISRGTDFEDMGDRATGTLPPEGGTRFVVLDFVPGNAVWMHRTDTLDYVIVVSGEIEMEMDDSKLTLRAGDTLIQRGTNHAWINRGQEVARVAFVMIDAIPLGIGNPVPREAGSGARSSATSR